MSIWNVEELVRITCGAAAEPKGENTKAVRVATAIDDADLGCKAEGVRKLLSVVLDMEIPEVVSQSKFSKGMVVVPERNSNGHNYVVGSPVMVLFSTNGPEGSLRALSPDLELGNLLVSRDCRLATEEEIRSAFGG